MVASPTNRNTFSHVLTVVADNSGVTYTASEISAFAITPEQWNNANIQAFSQ